MTLVKKARKMKEIAYDEQVLVHQLMATEH